MLAPPSLLTCSLLRPSLLVEQGALKHRSLLSCFLFCNDTFLSKHRKPDLLLLRTRDSEEDPNRCHSLRGKNSL
jgi:hypothetical protein